MSRSESTVSSPQNQISEGLPEFGVRNYLFYQGICACPLSALTRISTRSANSTGVLVVLMCGIRGHLRKRKIKHAKGWPVNVTA